MDTQATRNVQPNGPARPLPPYILGINGAGLFYEPIVEDPKYLPAVQELAPGHVRFPGGTIGNYYQWRTGTLEVDTYPDSSIYTERMKSVTARSNQLHPGGLHFEAVHRLCQAARSEPLLLLNLETSTPKEQAAWLAHLQQRDMAPRLIELGNEFWIAMIMDPRVLAKFPDAQSTLKLMKRYVDAVRPYLPEDAVFAAQSAASPFKTTQSSVGANDLMARMHRWDEEMTNESWFQAVTVHLYPEVEVAYGPQGLTRLTEDPSEVFAAMMAQVDEAVEQALVETEKQYPGKELWLTEWSANGVRFFFQRRNPGLTGWMIHCTIRMLLIFLKRPSITVSSLHTLSMAGGPYSMGSPAPGGDGFILVGPGVAMKWLNEAANHGASYRSVEISGTKRTPGAGNMAGFGYADLAGALFEKDDYKTLILQNASAEKIVCGLESLGLGSKPASMESLATPDLLQDFARTPLKVKRSQAGGQVELAPYSLTRIVWE